VTFDAPLCVTGHPRLWTHPALPAGAEIQFDPNVSVWKESAANTYTLLTSTPVNQPLLIRQGAGGPVLGSCAVMSVSVRTNDLTGNILDSYDATTSTVSLPVVVSGDLGDAEIRCNIIIGGVTFADGTTVNSLCAADFDSYGTANLHFIKANTAHSNCRQFSVWRRGICIATFN